MKYIYLDSNCFLKLVKKEPDYRVVESIALLAQSKELIIVTSAIAIVEVNRATEGLPISAHGKKKIIAAMSPDNNVMIVDLNREVAEIARDAVWDKGFDNYDAVHIATAIYAAKNINLACMHTFDKKLIKHSGYKGLVINEPTLLDYPYPQEPIPGL